MQLKFKCRCGHWVIAPVEKAGGKGKCPACGQELTVPMPPSRPAAPPAAPGMGAPGAPGFAPLPMPMPQPPPGALAVPGVPGLSPGAPGFPPGFVPGMPQAMPQAVPGFAPMPQMPQMPPAGYGAPPMPAGYGAPPMPAGYGAPPMPAGYGAPPASIQPPAGGGLPTGSSVIAVGNPCRSCGRPLAENSVICVHCGTNQKTGSRISGISSGASIPTLKASENRKEKLKAFLAPLLENKKLLGLLIFMIIALIVVYWKFGKYM